MRMKKLEHRLVAIEMTNGEFGRLQEVARFLDFARQRDILLYSSYGNSPFVLEDLFADYILDIRHEQMLYVDKLRKERGEKPLPSALTSTSQTAKSHAAADKACGRKWVCSCGACQIARRQAKRGSK